MLAMAAVSVPDGLKHLNWVDYVILIVMVYSVVSGAWVGFFAECVSVAGVAAGTFVAGLTYHEVGTWLGRANVPRDARDWAGFVAVFVVISFVFRFCSIKARRISSVLVPGSSNALAGALLGVLAGAIICLFAVVTVAYFNGGTQIEPAHDSGIAVIGQLNDPIHESQIANNCKSLVTEYVSLLPVKMHHIPGFTN